MKKITILSLFLSFSLHFYAQEPVIEGRFLPVMNTAFQQAWDTMASDFAVTSPGPNQFWDYSTTFDNIADITLFPTMPAMESPYGYLFPLATHASHLPSLTGDSLYYYFYVDTLGFHVVGNYSFIPEATTAFTYTDYELMIPDEIHYLDVISDHSRAIGDFTYSGFAARHQISSDVTYTADAYGTLALPLATFGEVMRIEEVRIIYDSIYVDFMGMGTYSFLTSQVLNIHRYHFMRNNTYGTTLLMNIDLNGSGIANYAWYSIPYNTGNIEGIVYNSDLLPVISGEAYLFRECSNFTKDDILAVSTLDGTGTYHFDSIPYGQYFIGVRPDPLSNPNSLFTYYGDTTKWQNATILELESDTSDININLCYHEPLTGLSMLSGNIIENFGYHPGTKNSKSYGEPVPGAEIYLEQEPEGEPIACNHSNEFGDFEITNVPNGVYRLFVDLPGLKMSNTYNITVIGGSIWGELDFVMGSDSIYAVNEVTSILTNNQNSGIKIFPNPAKDYFEVKLTENFGAERLSILSIDGKHITDISLNNNSEKTIIDIRKHRLSKGIYLLRLSGNKGEYFEKLVIE
ncbi:MAG: T9SS type A sorting domain-containing protein [Bacteroidales bacterium]|nr:T9SS type A sorting domain-containing protein [Bacteroidales bacterium]